MFVQVRTPRPPSDSHPHLGFQGQFLASSLQSLCSPLRLSLLPTASFLLQEMKQATQSNMRLQHRLLPMLSHPQRMVWTGLKPGTLKLSPLVFLNSQCLHCQGRRGGGGRRRDPSWFLHFLISGKGPAPSRGPLTRTSLTPDPSIQSGSTKSFFKSQVWSLMTHACNLSY